MTEELVSQRAFTVDWLSHNLEHWKNGLAPFRHRPVKVLEIGSFEGRSAIFFLQYLSSSSITCIDTFEGGEEHLATGQPFGTMADVEARFDQNIADFGERVRKLKGHSHDQLVKLRIEDNAFDIIYVDGDHHAASALLDACLAWQLLNPGGIMILDDYEWEPELPESKRPKLGINEFLRTIAGQYETLHRGYQIMLKKVEEDDYAPGASETPPLPNITLAGSSFETLTNGAVSPPLVSFVIINWNYSDYVGQAIESIKRQDYTFFECLIIDNGSEDNSVEVIQKAIEGDPRFRLHRFDRNMGQLGAAVWSLSEIKGRFVTFVDADDVLFPNFASTHLQTHLALPRSVSLTSSTVTEMDSRGQLISSRYGHVDLSGKHTLRGLRPSSLVVRFPGVNDDQYERLGQLVGIVPRWVPGWHWGPGTANMFRASILGLVRMGDGLQPIMRAADSHFNHICHSLTGSALIDVPLSAYRIHGRNYFTRLENIDGLKKGSREMMRGFRQERIASTEVLLENADSFNWLLGKDYFPVVDQCLGFSRGTASRRYGREAHKVFVRHAASLRSALGDRKFCDEIGKRFNYSKAQAIITQGIGRKLPVRYKTRLLLQAASRNFKSVRQALRLRKRRPTARVSS